MPDLPLLPVAWVGSSKDDLKQFPDRVQDEVGHALMIAQAGGKDVDAKPLKGFGGAGVVEIIERFDKNAYRCIYTTRLAGVVYVLHAFQKKSTHGIATAKHDIALVRQRLAIAIEDHAQRKTDDEQAD